MMYDPEKAWNEEATSGDWQRKSPIDETITKIVAEFVQEVVVDFRGKTILDIASGLGPFRYIPIESSQEVWAADISTVMLGKNPAGHKVQWDVREPIPEELGSLKFDVITSFFLMRYLTPDEQVSMVTNMLSLINDNGKLVIVDYTTLMHRLNRGIFDPNELISNLTLPEGYQASIHTLQESVIFGFLDLDDDQMILSEGIKALVIEKQKV